MRLSANIFFVCMVVFLTSSCGRLQEISQIETLSFELNSSIPADGARDVTVDTPIRVSFSSAIDANSIKLGTLVLRKMDDSVSLNTNSGIVKGALHRDLVDNILSFFPEERLEPGQTYTITITGLRNIERYTLAPTVLTFTTAAQASAPVVIVFDTEPRHEQSKVSVNQPIRFLLNSPIDPTSVEAGTVLVQRTDDDPSEYVAPNFVHGQASYDGLAQAILFKAHHPLAYGQTYTVILLDLINTDGLPVAQHRIQFTTSYNPVFREIDYKEGGITQYDEYEHDAVGKAIKMYRIGGTQGLGDNGLWLDGDDTVTSIRLFNVDTANFFAKQVIYSAPRNSQRDWQPTAEDVFSYDKTIFDINGNHLGTASFKAGDDRTWFTDDDNITGYIQRRQADNGDALRATFNSSGADENWLTGQDNEINFHARTTFNERQAKTFHILYRGTGEDGIYFTGDDPVQFYHEFIYDENDMLIRNLWKTAPGVDGVWFTLDDNIGYCNRYEYDTNGNLLRQIHSRIGGDLVCFSDDDIIRNYHAFTYDAVGNRINRQYFSAEGNLSGAGDDEIWFTGDDHLIEETLYLTDR